ncbi:MAG: type II toxin-antitoxin system VapC family toxin [Chloroflexota bacterium]|nr:type II toxin-antitoxin system VapC family toxin [Chloroflexota bacterium]
MSNYFFDTSAIVKRYVPEQGQSFILAICDPAQGHGLYISQAAIVEVVAAICRKARQKSITIPERDILINRFIRDSRRTYGIRLVTTPMYIAAGNLCRSYNLRAYDAVQLACAIGLRDKALINQALPPIFVCADNNLIDIAMAEGLSVENPHNYL